MGHRRFFVRVYRDRSSVEEAFERVEERSREAVEEVVKRVKPDFVLFDGDCAYESGLMVRPQLLRSLTFERTRETVSRLRRLGIPYAFRSDGRL